MPEPITISLVALTVAAVSPLYMILQRHFSVKNENLESRKEIAGELLEACELWSSILEKTINEAVYNTPQKLDKVLRCILESAISRKEAWQSAKSSKTTFFCL